MEASTPMLKQYHAIKANYRDCILFFRLGDFYEMFYDDAKTASGILDLVLTSRGKGSAHSVPMCGIPFHAADTYIPRLIKAGHKIAICEQVEDPAAAKGIVKRDVIRVITSGTYLDDPVAGTRYILALCYDTSRTGLAFTDPAAGTLYATDYQDPLQVLETMATLPIAECVYPANQEETVKALFNHPLLRIKNATMSPHTEWSFNPEIATKTLWDHFGVASLKGFGITDGSAAAASAGALLEYLRQVNKQPLRHIDALARHVDDASVFISPYAIEGLDLERLLGTIDHTITPMGRRLIRHWLYHPLKDPLLINERQEALAILRAEPATADTVRALLRHLPDIDRTVSRISCGYTHPRDFVALRAVLTRLPDLCQALKRPAEKNRLFTLESADQIQDLLTRAIDPGVNLSHPDGKLISRGFSAELDQIRDLQENKRQWLKTFQAAEIKRTGISSLKVGFNSVFGYYLEVTKPNLSAVPSDYIRKQTLVNAERFITQPLKEFEESMLSADARVLQIESEIVSLLREEVLKNAPLLHQAAEQLATLDVLLTLYTLSCRPGYVAPQIATDALIDIREGRHPVVEQSLQQQFIPNDTLIDRADQHLLVITGPNMAGKSTYIRQTALLVIMAQMGSFVPARSARIGIVDKIFTRIGAHDEISKGQSTFMVEMSETADILNNLSDRSLVILDEVGRGTSTSDGLSLAWAIAEALNERRVRTLFATHFHELTALAEECPGVKNYNVAVKEWKDSIVFLHAIVPGGSDDSYGIHVAKLAGVPAGVIQRARRILTQIELASGRKDALRRCSARDVQLSLFAGPSNGPSNKILEELDKTDLNALSPLEAFALLKQWKESLSTPPSPTPSRGSHGTRTGTAS